ncbi:MULTISPECIES: hypothetical protein [unclassified Streptomyces]|uniref:hypothetical protein n=1 Tax=unclassified Streptomyces TaxID=2593676 RepID=UPI000366D857|nr:MULTISPECIES: hypothetical protein [unclassified Streptomyces]
MAFGTLDSPTGRQLLGDPPTLDAITVSRELQQAWVRFATTGDPGWPAHRPDQQLTRVLDTESKTLPYPEQASRQIWKDHTPTPFDLIEDGPQGQRPNTKAGSSEADPSTPSQVE